MEEKTNGSSEVAANWFWAFSTDQERWSGPHGSIDEAVADAKEDGAAEDQEYVYVATGTENDPAEALDARRIFDDYGDYNPECSPLEDPWIQFWGASKEEVEELSGMLQAAFREWAKKHHAPGWYTIDGIPIKVDLTAALDVLSEGGGG